MFSIHEYTNFNLIKQERVRFKIPHLYLPSRTGFEPVIDAPESPLSWRPIPPPDYFLFEASAGTAPAAWSFAF